MPNWDRRFLELAEEVSTWSKDPSTKVGAVLVDDNRVVVGMGYNGFPRGVSDLEQRYSDRDLKYKMVVHAEVNAILTAGHRARDCSLYIYPTFAIPNICNECTKVAIQAGIKEVVGLTPEQVDPKLLERWAPLIEVSKTMLTEAGVVFRGV